MAQCVTFRLANQLMRSSKQENLDGSSVLIAISWIFQHWYMRTLVDKFVNFKDITHLWLMIVWLWLWGCLSMYDSNHCLAMFYISLNMLLRALSSRTMVAPQPSGLLVLIKDLKTVFMNSITCALGALQSIWAHFSNCNSSFSGVINLTHTIFNGENVPHFFWLTDT